VAAEAGVSPGLVGFILGGDDPLPIGLIIRQLENGIGDGENGIKGKTSFAE